MYTRANEITRTSRPFEGERERRSGSAERGAIEFRSRGSPFFSGEEKSGLSKIDFRLMCRRSENEESLLREWEVY